MTISREDVLLGDRFPEDRKAYLAQQARVHRLEGEEWERIKKAHQEKIRGERGKLHKLAGSMNESAAARERVEREVDSKYKRELAAAESEQRAERAKLPEVEGALNTYRGTLDRLEKGQAPVFSIQGQKKAIADLEKDLGALRANVKKVDGRVDAARKAFNAEVERVRRDALAQE